MREEVVPPLQEYSCWQVLHLALSGFSSTAVKYFQIADLVAMAELLEQLIW